MPKVFVYLLIILAVAAGSCKSGGQGKNAGDEIPDSVLNPRN